MAMSFLFDVPPLSPSIRSVSAANSHSPPVGIEAFHQGLIAKQPTLLEEKLKLHARIIDEFNLTLLEKLPRAELVRQVNAYVAKYVRAEKISLNQKELEIFS